MRPFALPANVPIERGSKEDLMFPERFSAVKFVELFVPRYKSSSNELKKAVRVLNYLVFHNSIFCPDIDCKSMTTHLK